MCTSSTELCTSAAMVHQCQQCAGTRKMREEAVGKYFKHSRRAGAQAERIFEEAYKVCRV